MESIRTSLVALRRLFQRKELTELWAAAFGARTRLDYGELRLLDAVREAGPGLATVGEVSRRLGLDPSRASRQVAAAVRKGLLWRRAEQTDGRKVALEITPRGAKLQERGSELTRARIGLALSGWTQADRQRFAALFGTFTEGMLASRATGSGVNSEGFTAAKVRGP
jgi:DNA-binding MarR family transcriptional regulator